MATDAKASKTLTIHATRRVLMLGWEFPPLVTGGLGAACAGLSKALARQGVAVRFMLPVAADQATGDAIEVAGASITPVPTLAELIFGAVAAKRATAGKATHSKQQGGDVTVTPVAGVSDRPSSSRRADQPGLWLQGVPARFVNPYDRPAATAPADSRFALVGLPQQPDIKHAGPVPFDQLESLEEPLAISDADAANADADRHGDEDQYAGDLFDAAERYAEQCLAALAPGETYEAVHAHDWLTFPAGRALARKLKCPLVVHVHSTEFDRSPSRPFDAIVQAEREGLAVADRVIAVSGRTRDTLIHRYGVEPSKVTVVYNGVDPAPHGGEAEPATRVVSSHHTVLFLGRVTEQKGPAHFLAAAREVLARDKRIRFVVAGKGDGLQPMVQEAAKLGLGSRMLFVGFLQGQALEQALHDADVLVMPSVSEPFGLVALEAAQRGLPVIVSKASGASEVLHHAIEVDAWDTQTMAQRILSLIHHPALRDEMARQAKGEVAVMTWDKAAAACVDVYQQAVG